MCESNASKHQAKGYKYFIEQYIADVKGELCDGLWMDYGNSNRAMELVWYQLKSSVSIAKTLEAARFQQKLGKTASLQTI